VSETVGEVNNPKKVQIRKERKKMLTLAGFIAPCITRSERDDTWMLCSKRTLVAFPFPSSQPTISHLTCVDFFFLSEYSVSFFSGCWYAWVRGAVGESTLSLIDSNILIQALLRFSYLLLFLQTTSGLKTQRRRPLRALCASYRESPGVGTSAVMSTRDALTTSRRENHGRVSPYPRVVPYTHTTAFLVVPAATVHVVSSEPQPTTHRTITGLSSTPLTEALPVSSSVASTSLSHLEDPFQGIPPRSSAHPQPPLQQPASQAAAAVLVARREAAYALQAVDGEIHQHQHHHHRREHRRCEHAAFPVLEEVFSDSNCGCYDKGGSRVSTPLGVFHRRRGEVIYKPPTGTTAAVLSKHTHSAALHELAAAERVAQFHSTPKGFHLMDMHRRHGNTPSSSDCRRGRWEGLRQYLENHRVFDGVTGRETRTLHAAASACSIAHKMNISCAERHGAPAPQTTPAAFMSEGAKATHTDAVAPKQMQKATGRPSQQTNERIPHAQLRRTQKESDVYSDLLWAQPCVISPLPKAPHIHTGPANADSKHEREGDGHSPEKQTTSSTQSARVTLHTSDSATPVGKNGAKRRTYYTAILAPTQALPSTPSPEPHEREERVFSNTETTQAPTAAAAASANASGHEDCGAQPPTYCSAVDETIVSALSPLSPSSSKYGQSLIKELVQRRLDNVQLTPEDLLGMPSPGSSTSPTRADDRFTARLPLHQHSVSPASLSGGVSSPLQQGCVKPQSESPPLRGRLSYGTAAEKDGEDDDDDEEYCEGVSERRAASGGRCRGDHPPLRAVSSSSLGLISPPFDTSADENDGDTHSPLPIPPVRTNSGDAGLQQERFMSDLRCRFVVQEESAAREWIVMDASVRLHHLACEERAAYHVAEVAQYRRRLQQVVDFPTLGISPTDVITPPSNQQRHPHEEGERWEESAAAAAAKAASSPAMEGASPSPPTSPLSPAALHRRMPSVASLPPLSPRRKTAHAAEDEDVEDVVSPPSPSPSHHDNDACSLSLSQESQNSDQEGDVVHDASLPFLLVAEAEACAGVPLAKGTGGTYAKATDEDAGDDQRCTQHESGENADWEDDVDDASEREVTWEEVGPHGVATSSGTDVEAPARATGSVAAAGSRIAEMVERTSEDISCYPDARNAEAGHDGCSHHKHPSPPLRIPSPVGVFHKFLQDVENDEEDARYLITGECPPPHVFQRWADRFLHDQRGAMPQAYPARADVELLGRGHDATSSPEAVEPADTHVMEHDAPVSYTWEPLSGSPEAWESVTIHRAGPSGSHPVAAVESFSRDDGRSSSRQRLCSERNRAWVMESFLEDARGDNDGGRDSTVVARPGQKGALQEHDGDGAEDGHPALCDGDVGDYNATGRYAPDPQIFDEENRLQRSPPSSWSSSSVSASGGWDSACVKSPSPPDADVPSALNMKAMPEEMSAAAAAAAAAAGPAPHVDADEPAFLMPATAAEAAEGLTPLTYPTEETYDAPLGSERDAWQVLMDDFIEGLVKLISNEA
jgi:hypothetical protein